MKYTTQNLAIAVAGYQKPVEELEKLTNGLTLESSWKEVKCARKLLKWLKGDLENELEIARKSFRKEALYESSSDSAMTILIRLQSQVRDCEAVLAKSEFEKKAVRAREWARVRSVAREPQLADAMHDF